MPAAKLRDALKIANAFAAQEAAGAAMEVAFRSFRATLPDSGNVYFGDLVTEKNLQTLHDWIEKNMPAGSATRSGAWEIAFRSVQSSLTRDSSYVSPEERAAVAAMTGSELRAAYQRDANIRRVWDIVSAEKSTKGGTQQ